MYERTDIYYWKCDREDAFHGTSDYQKDQSSFLTIVRKTLEERFGDALKGVVASCGQGNHRTFEAVLDGEKVFIRTEDGIEQDNYIAVEAAVTDRIAKLGVTVPETIAFDCSRKHGFAWQILPYLPYRDLNVYVKDGTITWPGIAEQIGVAIAHWQEISVEGFGPFSTAEVISTGGLRTLHKTYESYYWLNLGKHVRYLVDGGFLSDGDARRITNVIDGNARSLKLGRGVLVHKDLAVWNILGTESEVKSFIDWDDCIIGDTMDDLSLMGVTGEDAVTRKIVAAYGRVRNLEGDAGTRFWLCWLRNILFKAVIRQGAGYFKKTNDEFFLIGGGQNGADLAAVTRQKIEKALGALEKGGGFDAL